MHSEGVSGKNRTLFLCVVTDRQDQVEWNREILQEVVRRVPGNINSVFFHDFNSLGINAVCFNTRAIHLDPFAPEMTEIAFRNLAAAAIACAENQNPLHVPKV